MPKHRDPVPNVPNPKYPPTPGYKPRHPAPEPPPQPRPTSKPKDK